MLIPQRYEFSSKSQQNWQSTDCYKSCCWYHKGTNFQANHNKTLLDSVCLLVVADTTKVRIFKQITTLCAYSWYLPWLLLIPQRYEFSSKSQRIRTICKYISGCCWYHKGTNFQANHNNISWNAVKWWVVADTTKVRIFKQITTTSNTNIRYHLLLLIPQRYEFSSKSQQLVLMHYFNVSCCWYHKGTNFQANHNSKDVIKFGLSVVADTTKVRIFKQITTLMLLLVLLKLLLLIPQRYEFSSKSQLQKSRLFSWKSCCWYHKGTNFQANHNNLLRGFLFNKVVADTTKVRIFKQITTVEKYGPKLAGCCWYHKGTNFQANHNSNLVCWSSFPVVADTTKVRIFKQITTHLISFVLLPLLLLIPQRYEFSSKSQLPKQRRLPASCCCWYHKGTNFQANHNYLGTELLADIVVADTTKVRIFKQITTTEAEKITRLVLLLIPQRYEFSSKSQLTSISVTL